MYFSAKSNDIIVKNATAHEKLIEVNQLGQVMNKYFLEFLRQLKKMIVHTEFIFQLFLKL
jgi:hypothetical protein